MRKPVFMPILIIVLLFSGKINAQDIEAVRKEENKFIYSNSIKLFMGDSIYVEANATNGSLVDFVIVKSISDSTKTMSIKFYYDKFGQSNASILKVTNLFKKTLYYKAKIKTSRMNRYSGTSIMPIYPRIFGMEMWPYKIESIILYDFELRER